MSVEISIQEFNRQYQLYQKGDRYNLNLYETDLNHFMIVFFQDEIEDLQITYASKSNLKVIEKTLNCTSFSYFFDDIENLLDHETSFIAGYLPDYDLYFQGVNNLIEINYIKKEVLFKMVDRLLNGIDGSYKSRLKTELLINMEFD